MVLLQLLRTSEAGLEHLLPVWPEARGDWGHSLTFETSQDEMARDLEKNAVPQVNLICT